MFILPKYVCYASKGQDLSSPFHILFFYLGIISQSPYPSADVPVVFLFSGTSFVEFRVVTRTPGGSMNAPFRHSDSLNAMHVTLPVVVVVLCSASPARRTKKKNIRDLGISLDL